MINKQGNDNNTHCNGNINPKQSYKNYHKANRKQTYNKLPDIFSTSDCLRSVIGKIDSPETEECPCKNHHDSERQLIDYKPVKRKTCQRRGQYNSRICGQHIFPYMPEPVVDEPFSLRGYRDCAARFFNQWR